MSPFLRPRTLCGVLLVATWLAAPGRAQPSETVVLQLPYLHQFQFAGIYAAEAQGYFAEAGLKVEVRPATGERRSAVAEVEAGRAQFGIAQAHQLIASRFKGGDAVILAAIMQHSPQVLLSRAEDNFNTPHDLIGRRVALDHTSLGSEIRAMLEREGVGFDRITVVPNSWAVDELVTRQADAMSGFLIDTPFLLKRSGVPVRIMRPLDYGVDFYGDCLFTSARVLVQRPAVVARMREAVLRGWHYALQHPEELVALIEARYPATPISARNLIMDRPALEYEAGQIALLINAELVELGRINEGRIQRMAEAIRKYEGGGEPALLRGMIYQPPATWVERLGTLGPWLAWGFAATLVVTVLAVLTVRRLQGVVERRTHELREAQRRQRETFDQSPAPITENDYSAVAAELAGLRARGVTDLGSALENDPGLLRRLGALVRVTDANQLALKLAGVATPAELDRERMRMLTEESMDVFRQEVLAIWERRAELRIEKSYVMADGRRRDSLINWSAHAGADGPDYARVQLVHTDLTEVREASLALRRSEERYRLLFEQSPLAVVEFDYAALQPWFEELRAQGVTDLGAHLAAHPEARQEVIARAPLVALNEPTLQLLGAGSKRELVARLGEVFTENTVATRCENAVRIWNGILVAVGEIEVRRLDGVLRTLRYYWRMQDEGGRPSFRRTQSVLVDITEQKEAERALRESEERYRLLFETTPNPSYIYDAETLRFVMVNEVMSVRYGYTREELLRMSVLDIRPADEAARLRGYMENFHTLGARPNPNEAHAAGLWRHRRKDGTIILVEVYTHTVTLNGRLCVLVLPFDVTAKLAAEQALRESEARYRDLFENAAGGVYRSTPEGRLIAVNPALARMLGFESPAEMTAWSDQHTVAPLYVQPGRREEFLRLVRIQDRLADFESEVRRRDGSVLWIAETVRVVRDAAGHIQHFEGFVSDISARRRLDAEMTRASKLEAVGILAGGIAHDFNNILTVVLGNVTLAEMDTAADSSMRRMLRDAKQATLRARDLTQQLLTFAKGGDPVRAAVELPELLRESAGFALHGSKARAEFEFGPELRAVNADKGQLGQVIQNLVINSVQAMPQGGFVRLRAVNECLLAGVVGSLPAGEYVKISVADSGVGIAPEHLTKIFDPYFTTKQQGSGLGLATVYSILRKHQGHVEVESRLGAGTTFHLWLPVAREAVVAPPAETAPAPVVSARVLFMDDEVPILEMARMFLARLGMECEVATDGAAAIAKYRAALEAGTPFDVVVMDLTVPGGMGGREAMEHLRQIDPGVRAIVSSGYSRDPVLANYRAHGFSGILPKPYGLEHLQKALLQVVKSRQSAAPF